MPTMRVLTKHNAESDDEISVSRGDVVQLISVDHAANRLLVFKPAFINTPAAEGWIPGLSLGILGVGEDCRNYDPAHHTPLQYLSTGDEEKPDKKLKLKLMRRRSRSPGKPVNSWQQKLSFKINALSNAMMEPSFTFDLDTVNVQIGNEAHLECHIVGKPKPNVFWRTPDRRIALPDDRIDWLESDYGHYTFSLRDAVMNDSGTYTCLAVSEMGVVEKSANIDVMDIADPPSKPSVTLVDSNSVRLHWEAPLYDGHTHIEGYMIETSDTESSLWTEAISFVKETTQLIDKLQSGLTHFFRVCTYNTAGVSLPSPVSDPVVVPPDSRQDIPLRDDLRWKPHFEHLHKLDSLKSSFTGGEMRYYIHKSTKEKVLARCIFSRESAWFEKDIYTKCQHSNILLPLLYFESPLSNFIILPDLKMTLLEYLCLEPSIPELDFVLYSRQIFAALHCLQEHQLLHLNIIPESILITADRVIKLTAFEKAKSIKDDDESEKHKKTDEGGTQQEESDDVTSTPLSVYECVGAAEFLPVELAAAGADKLYPCTDIWSLGVFLYLMLSGVSPFYAESVEQIKQNLATQNIEFPAELFPHVSDGCLTLLKVMLIKSPKMRPMALRCMQCSWLNVLPAEGNKLSTRRLSQYLSRRKSQLTELAAKKT